MYPASCVLTILDSALKITAYIKDVAEGGKERHTLHREVSAVYETFLHIQDQFVKTGWAADTFWAACLRAHLAPEGTIEQLRRALEEAAVKLTIPPQDHLARTRRALK
jgi:cytochrome b